MWVQEVNFRNNSEDFKHMCRLIVELNNPEELGHHWTLGQLIDWQWGIWNDAKLDPNFFEKNCRLFYNYLGDLVGFAISESGTNRFMIAFRKQYRSFRKLAIQSVLQRPFGTGPFEISTIESDTQFIQQLEEAGFSATSRGETMYLYAIEDAVLKEVTLADGLTIEGMDRFQDLGRQMELKRYSFHGGEEISPEHVFAYHYVRNSPLYDASMDLVLHDQTGRCLSGCEGFIDYDNALMQIERVCTQKAFEGRGYARAVINECIRQGALRGVRSFSITAWNDLTHHLYSSFGQSTAIPIRVYSRA